MAGDFSAGLLLFPNEPFAFRAQNAVDVLAIAALAR
jgi:hypothetical protein